ncbi:hypothetical protein 056SW001B_79 [Bacillus phage 056SW001B]|uniref:Uncharacterized protein n=1 Tax=Bacillus phage 056SW001B TaxID=2601663 RepID=A0A5P8PIM5_9CAUD|nr:hypothetical protein 056SW001B_79 [Bacillus phage 056SW001B]
MKKETCTINPETKTVKEILNDIKTQKEENKMTKTTVKFEERGVLAGIISDPEANPYHLLSEIQNIVGYFEIERYMGKSTEYEILDHWVMENVEEGYWGVYYKEGHACIVNTSSKEKRFKNGLFKDFLEEEIKEGK